MTPFYKNLFYLSPQKKVYFFLCALVVFDRFLLLQDFGFKYVGSDDTIFWQGANDYMHGAFYTPYFYGQNYNFMLESVFAVPLLLFHVPFYIALPVASSFTTLFPFFLFSFVLLRRNYFIEALLFLSIPLLLPIEYGILTSISRGFVSSLFFGGFFIFPLLDPHKKSLWALTAFLTSFAYFVNPSSIVFSFPVCFYLLAHHFKSGSFYIIFLTSAFPPVIAGSIATDFVTARSDYNIHPAIPLEFHSNLFSKTLTTLDSYFSYFTPLGWFAGWLGLVIIFLIGARLLKTDEKKGITLIAGVLFIFLSLGISKVHDHLNTIFLSSARLYLCIPLFTGLAFFWGRRLLPVSDPMMLSAIVGVCISVFLIKASFLDMIIDKYTQTKNYGAVAIKKVDELCNECNRIQDSLAVYPSSLVIFAPSWQPKLNVPEMEFLTYACPLLKKDFSTTIISIYERRAWIYQQEKWKIEKNILFYNSDVDLGILRSMNNCRILSEQDPKMFIVTNNTLPTDSLMRFLKISFWCNPYVH